MSPGHLQVSKDSPYAANATEATVRTDQLLAAAPPLETTGLVCIMPTALNTCSVLNK